MIDKELFHNRARFQRGKEERERNPTWETVRVENAQENFCGEIKGVK